MKKLVKSLEIKLPKLTLEISGCDITRNELAKLIPELRKQCQISPEDSVKRAELDKNVQKCIADMASCADLAGKLEKEVENLQKAIMDAGGPRLKKQKAACEKALADLNNTEKALNSSKVDVQSSTKAVAKAKETRERLEKEFEQCQKDLQEKETEFKSLEDGAAEVMEAYEQVKLVEAEKRKELESASNEVEELKKSQSEIKCLEIDLLGQMEALEKQFSELERKKDHWERELSKLRAAEDEFDIDEEEAEIPPATTDGDDEHMDDAETPTEIPDGHSTIGENDLSSALPSFTLQALEKYSIEEIKDSIDVLQTERDTLAKNANMGAIAEYRKKEADYLSR